MKKITYKRALSFLLMTLLIFSTINISSGNEIVKAEDAGDYHGLKAEYYKSTSTSVYDFVTLVTTTADETINFYDNFTSILKARTGQTEACSVRWTGRLQPDVSEAYTFSMIGDNGFRLWVDNKLIIDHWINNWEILQTSAAVNLVAGQKYDIKVEYFQATGGADIKLQWSSPSKVKQVIPVSCLYQPVGSAIPIVTSSVVPVTGTTQQFSYPTLPTTVTVNFSDGNPKQLPVAWDYSDTTLFAKTGTVTVVGNISGTTAQAIATVTVSKYAAWQKQTAAVMTKWASEVTPDNALPEYPRMQLQRTDWMNLNGLWEFQPGAENDVAPVGQDLQRQILVPYPMESALSGVMTHYDRSWYRRTFTVPQNWSGKKLVLNFGAVDWESEIIVNGTSVGVHKGGYDAFSYDITPYLKAVGDQELIVRVYDPTSNAGNPRGKQTLNPAGIMYTSTSGIWQTVWLEPVAATSNIDNLKIEPDVDGGRLKLTVNTAGAADGTTVTATATDGTTVVASVSANPNTVMYLQIPNAKLWSPDNPFLYNLKVDLSNGSTVIDTVNSYFGMRKITKKLINGLYKFLLNDKETFLMGPLDQGFWPDGIYTAPTDAALKSDIEQEKALGFNMVRKHIKVEPARWYYWADKLGILVWQDMPSENSYDPPAGVNIDKTEYEAELTRMVQTHFNSPSIILWCIFNEDQGQYDPARLVALVQSLDSSRLVNQGSGGPTVGSGDMYDQHSYPAPACPTTTTQARVCGEFGGIGMKVADHMWDASKATSGYSMVNTASDLISGYKGYISSLISFKSNNGLVAAVYTEITDVENEVNGFMTYDRVMKADAATIKALNDQVINKTIYITDVLPTSNTKAQAWKYTTTTPSSDWYTTNFADTAWNSGNGGFATTATSGIPTGTTWNTSDIWLRKTFNPGVLTTDDINNLSFNLFHDEDCEIYINGVLAGSATGYSTSYVTLDMNQAGKSAIISNENNVIAVHCKQTTGGQGIDVGIVKTSTTPPVPVTPTPSANFSDNYDDGNANGWTNYGGTWTVTDGKYAVASNAGAKSMADGTLFTDFTYETDITTGTAGTNTNAGVVFRVTNPGTGADSYTGYYAGIGTGQTSGTTTGVSLGKANGSWTPLLFSPVSINPNQTYHMKVTAIGSSIKVYIDDMTTPIVDTIDTSYTYGAIGFRTWNLATQFDKVSVNSYVPIVKDTDATLSDLKVGGTTITGFDPNITTYNVILPAGTTTTSAISATVTDTGKAVAVITPASSTTGSAIVIVTAEDGKTTMTYTINFTTAVGDTAATVSAGITSIVAPAKDATKLTLPTVPKGYAIAIKSTSSTPAAISLDGIITPPTLETTVEVVLTVTKLADGTTADTAKLYVVVPAKTAVIPSNGGGTSGNHSSTGTVVSTASTVTVVTRIDGNSNVIATVDASSINTNNVNVIEVEQPAAGSRVQVQIPASVIGTGTGNFELNTNMASLSFPTNIVDSSLLSSGGTLQISQNLMAVADANTLLVKVPTGAKTNGKVFSFGMGVYDSNNKLVSDIHNFASGKSVSVTINLSKEDISGMDTSKISAFYFDTASNSWVDIGGTFDATKMTFTFNTTHFTDFTIMEKVVSNINRLAGINRLETSLAIAKEQYTDKKPDAVVLATANDFADALAGSGLAYKYNAPLLLVNKTVSDSQAVLDYISANLSKDKSIYILGETGVVSKEISDYLTSQGYAITRLGGKDRYETNQKIVDNLNVAKGTSLVIATGEGFADALSISSIADIKGFPVLLSSKNSLSASASNYITNLVPTTIYLVGGTGVLSTNIEDEIKKLNGDITIVRLGGNDRYETSMKIVDYFNLNTSNIAIATGVDFPDALSGAILAARKNSAVLLLDNKDIIKQKELLNKQKITNIIVFGGDGVLSNDIVTSLIEK